MKVYLPNSAFLGNIEAFVRHFEPTDVAKLSITTNEKWVSVHPVILAMVAALGQMVTSGNVTCDAFSAESKHYFDRMGLFSFLHLDSRLSITEHESAGRFIPLTQIQNSETH